jgi:2-methylisocitrate lyase-like PEP mutase family enzyme
VGADDEQTPWAEVVTATAGIVRAAQVPVTADIEAGWGETPDTLAPAMTQAEAQRLFIRS